MHYRVAVMICLSAAETRGECEIGGRGSTSKEGMNRGVSARCVLEVLFYSFTLFDSFTARPLSSFGMFYNSSLPEAKGMDGRIDR